MRRVLCYGIIGLGYCLLCHQIAHSGLSATIVVVATIIESAWTFCGVLAVEIIMRRERRYHDKKAHGEPSRQTSHDGRENQCAH